MHRALLIALWTLVGCAGSPKDAVNNDLVTFDQIFEVTDHSKNLDGCMSEGDAQFGDPFFRLLEDDDGGLQYFTCRSADDCNELSDDWQSFPEQKENKWDGTQSWTSYAQDQLLCTTYIRKSSLKFKDNGNAEITRYECNQTLGVEVSSESQCEDMEDDTMLCSTGSESCVNYEQVTATPVE